MSNEVTAQEAGDHHTPVTVIVNGQEKTVTVDALKFDELVSLAYDGSPPTGDNWSFTITYRRGHGNKPEGSLLEGETVNIKKGMVFNVTGTDLS
jgi:Multiubiquitin